MNHLALTLVFGASLLLGGCSGDTTREPATTYLGTFQTELTAFGADMHAHAAQIGAATDVTSMKAMELAHVSDAHTRMGSMGHDVNMMGTCTDDQGAMMDTGDVGTMVDQAMEECDRHGAAMAQMNSMTAAMAEEGAHQSAMAALMGQMTHAHDQMMSGGMMGGGVAGTYTCSMVGQP